MEKIINIYKTLVNIPDLVSVDLIFYESLESFKKEAIFPIFPPIP